MAGAAADTAGSDGLKAELSLFDSITIVAGSMIGSAIFIVSADIARHVGSPAALLAVWIAAGLMTIAGALALRRTGGDDAAGGRPVHLPARGLRRDAGVPVRMDPVAGDSDRHDRGGGRSLRAVRRGVVAGAGRPDVVWMAGRGAQRRARRGDRGDRVSHLRQPARARHGAGGAEFFHQRQGALAGTDNSARMYRGAQP